MQTGGFLPPDVIVYGVLRGHRMGWRSEMYSHHFIQVEEIHTKQVLKGDFIT